MSLRYALLALLRVDPQTGYDLAKRFSASVGHVWHAPDSQIYPELRRMEAAGLVEAREQPRGARGTRRAYAVTAAGREDFLRWVASPPDYPRERDPAHLRAAYLEAADPADARAFFSAHAAHHRELAQWWRAELDGIEAGENAMLRRRLEVTLPAERDRTTAYKRFAYEGLVERALAEVAWAERGLALVDHLGARGVAPGEDVLAPPQPGVSGR